MPIPEGLDLDAWINEPMQSESESSEDIEKQDAVTQATKVYEFIDEAGQSVKSETEIPFPQKPFPHIPFPQIEVALCLPAGAVAFK